MGGWGLKNLTAWNKALLAKSIWKIQETKNTLWINWVNQFYGSYGSIWDWECKKDDSPLIKQLLGICKEIVLRLGSVDLAKTTLSGWFVNCNGTAKAYDFFVKKIGRWPWKPLLWKSCIIPKHRFILWLFAHEKLLTRYRQCYIEDKVCVLCNIQMETSSHLFFECNFSRAIWHAVRILLGMDKLMQTSSTLLRAFRSIYRGNSYIAKARCNATAACVYAIWTARNRAIFEDEKPTAEDIV